MSQYARRHHYATDDQGRYVLGPAPMSSPSRYAAMTRGELAGFLVIEGGMAATVAASAAGLTYHTARRAIDEALDRSIHMGALPLRRAA